MDKAIFQGDYASCYNLFYSDKNYKEEAAYVRALIARHELQKTRTILDLGCGTGVHDRYLSQAGFAVTGIDQSADMVKQASSTSGPGLEFKTGNIQNLQLDKKFDVAISLFHVMSYQTTPEQLLNCFLSTRRHLNPGGTFVFDFWHGAAVLADLPSTRIKRVEDEHVSVIRLSEPILRIEDATIDVKFTFFMRPKSSADGPWRSFEEVHRVRYWFLWELTSLLQHAGFTNIKFEEWLTSREISLNSWYGCVIAS